MFIHRQQRYVFLPSAQRLKTISPLPLLFVTKMTFFLGRFLCLLVLSKYLLKYGYIG